jgi:hypothetical protein
MATAACCNIHLRVETEQIKRASKPCKTRMQRSNLPLLSFSLPPLKWRKEIPLHIYYNYLYLSLLDLDSWLLSYISWSAPVHIINAPLRIARWLLDHVIIGILIMSSMLLWSIHGNLPLPVMLHAHDVDYGLHWLYNNLLFPTQRCVIQLVRLWVCFPEITSLSFTNLEASTGGLHDL